MGVLPSLKNRMFQECLTVTFAAMLSNILSTFMLSGYILVPVWVTWAITTIYFILTPLMGMVYYLYAVSVIYEERPQLNRMILLGGIPGAVYTLLVLSNFFTKCLFDITANQGYEQGSLIFITYLIFYAYCHCGQEQTLHRPPYLSHIGHISCFGCSCNIFPADVPQYHIVRFRCHLCIADYLPASPEPSDIPGLSHQCTQPSGTP